jgi:hypothetical protein
MIDITPNVSFDTIAREWRCKWSEDSDKESLVAAQKELEAVLKEVKGVKGVKSVQRVVCGGCLDFKVVTALDADSFGKWEESKFAPEEKFLEKVKVLPPPKEPCRKVPCLAGARRRQVMQAFSSAGPCPGSVF